MGNADFYDEKKIKPDKLLKKILFTCITLYLFDRLMCDKFQCSHFNSATMAFMISRGKLWKWREYSLRS